MAKKAATSKNGGSVDIRPRISIADIGDTVSVPRWGVAIAGLTAVYHESPASYANAGDDGVAVCSHAGHAVTGKRGVAIARNDGWATAETDAVAVAGNNGHAVVADGGVAVCGPYGFASTGGGVAYSSRGTCTAGVHGSAIAARGSATSDTFGLSSVGGGATEPGKRGIAKAGDGGIAIAWNTPGLTEHPKGKRRGKKAAPLGADTSLGSVGAGQGGVIISFFEDKKTGARVPVLGVIGELYCSIEVQTGLKPGVLYAVNPKTGKFEENIPPTSARDRSRRKA